ncbi:xylose ABC transporter ATP-binding protein [Clostridiaceae bacterium UIB06]|uniref:Xylose ABC transporter ATP-binding protein n=1 Tax=Clostridium thailandense TaxID=2794346 RepID=A0A949WSJ0_9CLOT|nr:xylose ABC transporter ATP-binding protein [Clostridium thailandense]MBV7275136.1 xylose ABC transporter ATP-binding protein [Clostridium thailandense]MCH5137373.1 xylose ABC transporter ATP-binding protein [Clostridiaceae bacterium UIB06]
MSEYILEMNNITKEFSGVKALDNVCLKVKKGEIHALCGENGAGKSTLMKVLSGVYPSGTYAGDIIYDGKKLDLKGIKDSENAGIAIIHQELALIKELSVAENIFIGNEINHNGIVDFNEMYNKTKELLKEVKLNINPTTLIKELGIGQQQLVEIAKALSKNSNVLILDEPTAPLTDSEVETLMGIMKDLRKKGVTCIYISHRLNEVIELSNTVTIIRDGKSIGTEPIENLDQEKIINMMVGREMTDLFPREEHKIGEKILEVKNFNVYDITNKDKLRVKNANFHLKRGEILGVAGLVGSGRTELVSSIFGSYEGEHNGEIYYLDKKINISNPDEALKKGIAMVPEDRKRHGIVSIMSVRNNITLANLIKYQGKLDYLNKDTEIIDVTRLVDELKIKTSSIDLDVKSLSGGNQQKVVLAKNLLIGPQVLILDEPTRGIDVGAKYEIYKLMFKLVKMGISIIMVSSELPEVLGISDRVLVMHEGEIKGDFDNIDLTQETIMQCAIGGNGNGR